MSNTLFLFDVDGTLTPSRQQIRPDMKLFMERLIETAPVAFVGGSDLAKITWQLGEDLVNRSLYTFSENGCVVIHQGTQIQEDSIAQQLGEDVIQRLINFCLRYIADLDIPIKRGTFIEYRKGMINVSPIGRNCSQEERDQFFEYDKQHAIRTTFRQRLIEEFGQYNLQFAIGGQISMDCFPKGWDKTKCLSHLTQFEAIHFFGDMTHEGGNDHEIYESERTIGHKVENYEDTIRQVTEVINSLGLRL